MRADPPINSPDRLVAIGFNPNGIRALFRNNPDGVKHLVATYKPDVIVFNEIKGNAAKQTEMSSAVEAVIPGFKWLWNNSHKAGVHGLAVAINPNLSVLNVDYGFGDGIKEIEGRLITLELERAFVIGLYAVNSGTERLAYKLEWLLKLHAYMERLRKTGKMVIAIGDWNVAPEDADVYDSVKCRNLAGFTVEERHCFRYILSQGWVDVFRAQHPHQAAFTYFGHTTKTGKRFNGWRIDHAIVDVGSYHRLKMQCEILPQYLGSDHCPIVLTVQFPHQNPVACKAEVSVLPTLARMGNSAEEKNYDIYIGGKRFKHGWRLERSIWALPKYFIKEYSHQTLVNYETHLREKLKEQPEVYAVALHKLLSQGRSLKLGCRCANFESCHGTIIIKLAQELLSATSPLL